MPWMLWARSEKSMAYKIHITSQAETQLDRIVSYLAKQLGNPLAAISLLDQIEAVYRSLSNQPFMYETVHDDRLSAKGYHKAPVENYLMIYVPDEKSKCVHVMGFFHSLENYRKKL